MVGTLTIVASVAGVVVGGGIGALAGSQLGGDSGHASTDGPSESTLRGPADALGVDPTPTSVANAVDDVVGAVRAVRQSATHSNVVDIPRDASITEAASELERALTHDRLAVGDPGKFQESTATSDRSETNESQPLAHVREAAQSVRRDTRTDSRDGSRLLDYLAEPSTGDRSQVADTLRSTIGALEEYGDLQEVVDATGTQPLDDARSVDELERRLADVAGEPASLFQSAVRELGTTVEDLEQCRSTRQRLERAADPLCSTAVEQTSVEFDSGSVAERLGKLSNAVNRGAITFEDGQTTTTSIVTEIERTTSPESKLARDFIDQFGDHGATTDHEFRSTVEDVLDAVDEAERLRHRFDGIDAEGVTDLADEVLTDLDAGDPVQSLLEDRVDDLRDTVARAGDGDHGAVFAAQQELRFYQRTFLPNLRQSDDATAGVDSVAGKLDAVEERRSHIRTNYPSKYPDHNHNIPIHFLELAEALHGEAVEAADTNDIDRADALLDAADMTLDWIEQLYERHAYSALLQQLRG